MQSLWNDSDAAKFPGDLGQRVYTSRLLGCDRALVLHGGGNTSVKVREKNIFGEEEEILYVKGSGGDLGNIEASGFAPLRLKYVLRLAELEQLSDTRMAAELRCALTNPAAPNPSVESILHAILPYKFVDHTHADAFIAVCNTVNGAERVKEVYGDSVVHIPYVMPGFELSKFCARAFAEQRTPRTIGMILMHHGVFSFGETAREAYERMIELVTHAEEYLAKHDAWNVNNQSRARQQAGEQPLPNGRGSEIAALRKEVSDAAGFPVVFSVHDDAQALIFARRKDVKDIALQGPATPDHVMRTKRLPLVGRDVKSYCADYKNYFSENTRGRALKMLDTAPRIILDKELGLCAIGRTARDAAIVEEIYRHTIEIILRGTALGGYRALPASDLFEIEYWELEQAKLSHIKPKPFDGEVALVTGAASGIGKACAEALLARGAAVTGLDLKAQEKSTKRPDQLELVCDITDEAAVERALESTARKYGGLDMLILNAGIFPPGARIETLKLEDWQKIMRVNLDANFSLMRAAYPLLKLSPRGGRVVVIGSKNVPAPGPGVAAYSASKAALTQLARVAALEWGAVNIRVNVIHPNMVFDTAIWTTEVLAQRAAHYGMSVEQYRTNNILRTEVHSADVAALAAEMCSPLFAKTTGAQVPIDGGNDRVI